MAEAALRVSQYVLPFRRQHLAIHDLQVVNWFGSADLLCLCHAPNIPNRYANVNIYFAVFACSASSASIKSACADATLTMYFAPSAEPVANNPANACAL